MREGEGGREGKGRGVRSDNRSRDQTERERARELYVKRERQSIADSLFDALIFCVEIFTQWRQRQREGEREREREEGR
jgi:hypothetical protein